MSENSNKKLEKPKKYSKKELSQLSEQQRKENLLQWKKYYEAMYKQEKDENLKIEKALKEKQRKRRTHALILIGTLFLKHGNIALLNNLLKYIEGKDREDLKWFLEQEGLLLRNNLSDARERPQLSQNRQTNAAVPPKAEKTF